MIRENNKQLLNRLMRDMTTLSKITIEAYPSLFKITAFVGGTKYHINRDLFDFLKPLLFVGDLAVIHPDTTVEELMKDKDILTLSVHSKILAYQKDNSLCKMDFSDPIIDSLFSVYRSAEERLRELADEKRIGISPLGPGYMYLNYINTRRLFEDEKDGRNVGIDFGK